MKIFYGRDFIEHPCTPEHNTVPEQHGLTLLIYWYLQHTAVNDTKTHGHRHLSSRAASETFAALPLPHTHFDHLLMARHVFSLITATTLVLSTVLHMGSFSQGTRSSSPFGNTLLVGCTHSCPLCPTADTQVPVASGGKQQHSWGASVQTCTLQDLAFLPRSPCESYFFPRAASLTCAPSSPFQLQWGTCTEPRLQSCWLISFGFAFKCPYICSLFSR